MASGMDKGKARAVDRSSPSPQAPDVGHHPADDVPHAFVDPLRQQMRDRLNYGDTPYARELAQAGSSRPEHQASPLDHGDAGEQSSVPMGQPRFLPTGSAVEVGGWVAYTSAVQEESAVQQATDAGHSRRNAGSDTVYAQKWTKRHEELYREYKTLQRNKELYKATPEQRAANRLHNQIGKQRNPDIAKKDKQRKVDRRDIASQCRKYLAEKEGIWVLSRDTHTNKTIQSPEAVHRAAQQEGYTQDKKTLERRSQRYANDPEKYQETGRE